MSEPDSNMPDLSQIRVHDDGRYAISTGYGCWYVFTAEGRLWSGGSTQGPDVFGEGWRRWRVVNPDEAAEGSGREQLLRSELHEAEMQSYGQGQ